MYFVVETFLLSLREKYIYFVVRKNGVGLL